MMESVTTQFDPKKEFFCQRHRVDGGRGALLISISIAICESLGGSGALNFCDCYI